MVHEEASAISRKPAVVYSHGKDSSPYSRKAVALQETCASEGYQLITVDYRGIDSPQERVLKLVDACKDVVESLVLIGSSLGAYVSLAAAPILHARGVFLLAPAVYFDGLPPLREEALECPIAIVHGWNDDVVPLEHSLRLGRRYRATVHIVEDDHLLHRQMGMIRYCFENFLVNLEPRPRFS